MRDTDQQSVTLVRSLLNTLARFDLTPDDRATLDLIRGDVDTMVHATSYQNVPEAQAAILTTLRDLLEEAKTIARKYA